MGCWARRFSADLAQPAMKRWHQGNPWTSCMAGVFPLEATGCSDATRQGSCRVKKRLHLIFRLAGEGLTLHRFQRSSAQESSSRPVLLLIASSLRHLLPSVGLHASIGILNHRVGGHQRFLLREKRLKVLASLQSAAKKKRLYGCTELWAG